MMNEKLIKECKRQEESCLYTSTTLYIWLREARFWKAAFIIIPIIFGAIASWSILDNPNIGWMLWVTASAALIAGILPAIREALNLDVNVENISLLASQFKHLQDRFRLAADTGEEKDSGTLDAEVRDLLERLDEARKSSITPPERCFIKARKKISEGHYSFDVDKQQKT